MHGEDGNRVETGSLSSVELDESVELGKKNKLGFYLFSPPSA